MAVSRPKRWAKACSDASAALGDLQEAISELQSLQEEYQEWADNLPENLQSSALADKLQTIVDLDLSQIDQIEDLINEAESVDLPLGFGRD
jgi:DNA repair exonuclease SbcCD ATPase subunit